MGISVITVASGKTLFQSSVNFIGPPHAETIRPTISIAVPLAFKSSNFFNNGLINESKIKEHSKKIISDFNVNTDNIELKSQFLSGGNLQKLIIGRELITSPDLLICFNPTWGLDVGAINYIHETLIKINEQNKSIILISTDTDELLKLSDKISVIHKGKLSKIMNADEVTSEKLGILMGGGEID